MLYTLSANSTHIFYLAENLPRWTLFDTFLGWIVSLGTLGNFLLLGGTLILLSLFFLGLPSFIQWNKFQRAIDSLGFTNGLGEKPKLIGIKEDGLHRLKLRIRSTGVGLNRYETKKDDLEASLGHEVEKLRTAENFSIVEVLVAKRRLPTTCSYFDLKDSLTKPYSFIVGESIGGKIIQCIRDLPHLLIAGTTGGGKSVFFKQALLGLLKTSPSVQMYLLDLKGGVEMKEFGTLPNVDIAKNEKEAVILLRQIHAEMKRRFDYLHEKGYKKIEPDRDGMDLIVVGIDEASVLYSR